MNFSLTPQLESYVRERAKSGGYNNASEVVREAIRLFKQTEEEYQIKLNRLRHDISVGDNAVKMNKSSVFNSEQELDDFFAKL